MTKVAIWARVSTGGQDATNQVRELRAFAKRRGWKVVETYEVQASGFKGAQRDSLNRAIEQARHRDYDILLVWGLDRLTREGIRPLFQIVDTLAHFKVRVISLQEPWTDTPAEMYQLLLAIAGFIANWTSERQSKRTKAGIERAREQGIHIGRKQVSLTTAQAREAIRRYNSTRKAAKALGVSVSTLRRRLAIYVD